MHGNRWKIKALAMQKLVWSETVTCESHAASDVLQATESHLVSTSGAMS